MNPADAAKHANPGVPIGHHSLQVDASSFSGCLIASCETTIPVEYRLVELPDGKLVLQGRYTWQQGMAGGFEWRDIPTIKRNQYL